MIRRLLLTVAAGVALSAAGTEFVPREQESRETRAYREHLTSEGVPSEIAAAGYVWRPGGELMDPGARLTADRSAKERRAA